jgi:hypothetical protein
MHDPKADQRGKKFRGIAEPLTKLPHTSVRALGFGRGPAFNGHQGGAHGQMEKQFPLNAFRAVRQLVEQI